MHNNIKHLPQKPKNVIPPKNSLASIPKNVARYVPAYYVQAMMSLKLSA